MSGSGGADAAAGFRYQHLVTIEALLDAFDVDAGGSWRIGVDVRGQDSADYVVISSPGAAPQVAVQVKSSLPTSSTQLSRPDVISMLSTLHAEHPGSGRFEIRTNRRLTGPAQDVASALTAGLPVDGLASHVARVSTVRTDLSETSASIAERLRTRIARYRSTIHAEIAGNVTQLVVSRLRDLVDEKATAASDQYIDGAMVARILRLPGQQLAQASGGRQYGRLLGLPLGEVIGRERVTVFLDAELPGSSSGVPRIAVVTGAAGTGKSSAVSEWVKRSSERFFCAVWLAGGSEELLQAQVPTLLEQLGQPYDPAVPASQALREVLESIPYPWLLVLDGAPSVASIEGWLPSSGFGDVVITSQDSNWPASHARVCPIGAFTLTETAELVRRRLGAGNAQEQVLTEDIARLASTMGYWPLAIDMACHWIARRGGRLSTLQDYLDRVGDVDLDEEQSVPVGYTHTAVQAILLAWNDLSDTARVVLLMGLLCGGDDVPLDAVAGAVAELPEDLRRVSFDQEVVFAELSSSSLVTRFLKDSRDPEAPGRDRIAVHESLRLVADGRWEYPGIYVLVLSNALDGRARPLRDAARIQAAASYLPAGTSVLMVAAMMLDVGDQLPFAPAMHNAGDLLLLTGSAEQAAFWLTQAAGVYAERIENDPDPGMRMVEYFFVSAGRLTTALARTPHTDRIDRVVEFALGVANAHPDAVSTPMVQAALDIMAGALHVRGSSETGLLAEVRKLQVLSGLATHALPDTAFASWSIQLAEAADRALILMQNERWDEAMDSFLIAANAARDTGAMEHEIVETGIYVGVALLNSMQQRVLAQLPARWHASWQRFLDWHSSLEDLAPHQQARLAILDGAVAEPPPLEEMREALQVIEQHAGQSLSADEVSMWREQVTMLDRSRALNLPWELFSEEFLAEGNVELTRMHDGGQDVMVWLFASPTGLPGVAFFNISATVNRGHGWEDPQPRVMRVAGFPEHDPTRDALEIPAGWTVMLTGDELCLMDADETPWLTTDLREFDSAVTWRQQFRRARFVHVIYGDLGGARVEELLALPDQAAVTIHRRRRWWRGPR